MRHVRNAPPYSSAVSSSERQIAAAVSLLMLAIYLTTTALRFQSIDEVAVFSLARSLVGHGSFDVDGMLWTYHFTGQGSVVAPGVDGHFYSLKDLAPSVMIAPLVWAGYRLGLSPVRAAFMLPPLVTALTAGLLYRLARRLGYSRAASALGALTFGLTSMAWPYAETLFTQPFIALFLLMATASVYWAREQGAWRAGLSGGLGTGLAGLSGVAMWLFVPVFLLYLVPWEALRGPGRWAAIRRARPPLIAFASGIGGLALIQAVYNAARFGSPFDTGHVHTSGIAFQLKSFLAGGFGLLLSTPRGVVWYAPYVLLVPIGAALAWRRHRRLVLLVTIISILILGLYSFWFMWWGGLSWGPRFLVSPMPLWSLLVVPLFERLLQPAPWVARLGAGVVLLASFIVQAVASPFNVMLAEQDVDLTMRELAEAAIPDPRLVTLIDPAWLPAVRLARLVGNHEWNVLWMARGRLDGLLLAAQLLLVALAGFWLVRLCRERVGELAWWGVASQGVLSVLVAAIMLVRYPRAPDGYFPLETAPLRGVEQVILELTERAMPGDGLVLLLPGTYLGWLDRYNGALPEVNFFIEDPLRPESARALEQMAARHDRLWLVSRGTTGGNPANGVERWLSERAFTGSEMWAEDGMRLVPYIFARRLSDVQPVRGTFGIPNETAVTLVSYRSEFVRHSRVAWLNVELVWQSVRLPPIDYSVTVQLFYPGGERVGQHDGQPAAGYAPITTWEPGRIVIDRHSLFLPADLSAGDYVLMVGLYDWLSGEHLPLLDGSGDVLYLSLHIP